MRRAFRVLSGGGGAPHPFSRPGGLNGYTRNGAQALALRAVAALCRRGCRRAVNSWRELLRLARRQQKALAVARVVMMRRALRHWEARTHALRVLAGACRVVLMRRERSVLRAWRAAVAVAEALRGGVGVGHGDVAMQLVLRARLHLAAKVWRHEALARSLCRWLTVAASNTALERRVGSAVSERGAHMARLAIGTWRSIAASRRRPRIVLAEAIDERKRRALREWWRRVRGLRRRRRCDRALACRIDGEEAPRTQRVRAAWNGWRSAWRRRATLERACALRRREVLRRGLSAWQAAIVQSHREASRARCALLVDISMIRCQRRSLRAAMRLLVHRYVRTPSIEARLVASRRRAALLAALAVWAPTSRTIQRQRGAAALSASSGLAEVSCRALAAELRAAEVDARRMTKEAESLRAEAEEASTRCEAAQKLLLERGGEAERRCDALESELRSLREAHAEEAARLGRELRREGAKSGGLEGEIERLASEARRANERADAQAAAAADARQATEAERERANAMGEAAEEAKFDAARERERATAAAAAAEAAAAEAAAERERTLAAVAAREEAEHRARQEAQKANLAARAEEAAMEEQAQSKQKLAQAVEAVEAHRAQYAQQRMEAEREAELARAAQASLEREKRSAAEARAAAEAERARAESNVAACEREHANLMAAKADIRREAERADGLAAELEHAKSRALEARAETERESEHGKALQRRLDDGGLESDEMREQMRQLQIQLSRLAAERDAANGAVERAEKELEERTAALSAKAAAAERAAERAAEQAAEQAAVAMAAVAASGGGGESMPPGTSLTPKSAPQEPKVVVQYVEVPKPKTRSVGVGTTEKPPSDSLLRHTTASKLQHNSRRRFAIEAEQQLAQRSGYANARGGAGGSVSLADGLRRAAAMASAVDAFQRAGGGGGGASSVASASRVSSTVASGIAGLGTPVSSVPPSPDRFTEEARQAQQASRGVGFFVKDREGSVGFLKEGYSPATAAERLKQAASVLTIKSPGAALKSYEQPRHGQAE